MFFSPKRFLTLFTFIACFAMFTYMVSAIEIELPLNTILLEAEAGEMDGGVTIVEHDEASEGKAIDSPAEALTQHEIILPVDGDWSPPVGLCGELMMMSLVRGVTLALSSSTSNRKSSSSRSGTGTAFAPLKFIIDS